MALVPHAKDDQHKEYKKNPEKFLAERKKREINETAEKKKAAGDPARNATDKK